MNETLQKQISNFGGWALTFGFGYFLLSHLEQSTAAKIDLAFIAVGFLAIIAAWAGRRRVSSGN